MKNKISLYLLFVFTGMLGTIALKAQPVFTGGSPQSLSVCQNSSATNISALVGVSDTSSSVMLTWSQASGPTNGTLVAAYVATADGGTITPTDMTYMPNPGYIGTDSFIISVTDGSAGDTALTVIYVTVNPLPAAITGVPTPCTGVGYYFTDSTPGGAWTSSNPASATVDSATGVVTGVLASVSNIRYTIVSTGCRSIMTVTVITSPSAVSGADSICTGATARFYDGTPGGSWSNTNTSVASIDTTGVETGISAGTDIITYTISNGCTSFSDVTITPSPAAITGVSTPCTGASYNFADSTPGGVWSSSNPASATVDSATGIVTGVLASISDIKYTLISTGCRSIMTVTVITSPYAVSADADSICSGATTSFYDGTSGGTWSNSNTSVVSVDSIGRVTGISAGTDIITYTISNGCSSFGDITINPTPVAIIGDATLCIGNVDTFTDSTVGGVWTSGNPAAATIDSTGLVTAILGATLNIRYTISDGCASIKTITVISSPSPVLGSGSICTGASAIYTDSTSGGAWSSSDTTLATVDSMGNVTGVSAGMPVIQYFLSTGCLATIALTVNPLPNAYNVSGGGSYCAGSPIAYEISLDNSDTGFTYQLYNDGSIYSSPVAGIADTLNFGTTPDTGTYTIVSTNNTTGCSATMAGNAMIISNPLPTAYTVTGGGGYCYGTPPIAYDIALSNSDTGFSYQLYNDGNIDGLPMAGNASSLDFGTTSDTGTYTIVSTNNTTNCSITMAGNAMIIENPLPNIDTVTGGGNYCSGGTGAVISINTSDTGISYQLYHRSLPIGSAMTGTGSAFNFGSFTDSGSYMAIATNITTSCVSNMAGSAVVNVLPLPSIYTVTGGGNYCSGGAGVGISLSGSDNGVNYSLYNGALLLDSMSGTGSTITFGSQTMEGSYTIVAINATTLCSDNMTGSAAIIIIPLPVVFTVTGGGNYCSGGTGVDIGLNASIIGDIYQLYNGSTALGSPLGGTSASLDFGMQTGSGTYTVIAVDTATSCINTMAGNPVISIDPLPVQYTVTGGGTYCPTGSGVPVGLDFSDTGASYQLYDGGTATGSPIPGTDSALSFGLQATGVYMVIAKNNGTSCTDTMSGSAGVLVIPPPVTHAVTGGGNYCAGGVGVAIGLNGSNAGVNYQLYDGTTVIGGPVSGTDSTLSFGLDTAAGVYTVIAYDTATTCTANMADSATIIINPLLTPMVTLSTGMPDTVCAGTSVTFSASPVNGGTSPTYQWMVNGVDVGTSAASYSYIPTNGNLISVKLSSTAECLTYDTTMDSMSITVWANGTPAIQITPDRDTVCKGTPVTFTVADTFQGPSPSYIWEVNGVSSGTGSLFTYTPSNGDIIYCGLVSDYLCRLATLVPSNNVTLTVDSPIAPSIEIDANPGTYISSKGQVITLTAVVTNGGASPSFEWFSGSSPIPGATSDSVHIPAPPNNDSISCRVTRNDACRLTTFNGVIIVVNYLGIEPVTNISGTSMYPNPNNGEFTLTGSTGSAANEDLSVEISDMSGQSVYKGTIMAKNGTIDAHIILNNDLANGNYLLNLHSASGNTVLHFVIEK